VPFFKFIAIGDNGDRQQEPNYKQEKTCYLAGIYLKHLAKE